MAHRDYTVVVGDSTCAGACVGCGGHIWATQMTGIHPDGVRELPELYVCPTCDTYAQAAEKWRVKVENATQDGAA